MRSLRGGQLLPEAMPEVLQFLLGKHRPATRSTTSTARIPTTTCRRAHDENPIFHGVPP